MLFRKCLMKNVIVLNKKEGETPLFALEKFRRKNPKYLNTPMTYAGRLDPMASGVLVILAGEEIKNKDKYLGLDKEYEFSILFGFSTDTYDILGKVVNSLAGDSSLGNKLFSDAGDPLCLCGQVDLGLQKAYCLASNQLSRCEKIFASLIRKNLKYFKGNIKQKYPIYSSKTVKGKPLFSYARNGEDVEIPERDIFIKNITLKKVKKINNKSLLLNIEKRIQKVKGPARRGGGDFRQKEILKIWKNKLTLRQAQGRHKPQTFYIADFKIYCGSGTYVRGIANSLGEKVNIPAVAFSIKRTKVGKFSI